MKVGGRSVKVFQRGEADLLADVDGSDAEVDRDEAGAGACVRAGDDEVAVVAAGTMVVEGAQANVDGEIAVAVVAAGDEVERTGADVDLTVASGADGVEVEVAVAEVDLGFGAGEQWELDRDGGVGVAGETEADGGGIGLDADAVDVVLEGVAGGLVSEVDGEAEVVEVAPGADGEVGAAYVEIEPAGSGVGTDEFEVARLEGVSGLAGEVVRGDGVVVAADGVVGVERGGKEAKREKERDAAEEVVAHGMPRRKVFCLGHTRVRVGWFRRRLPARAGGFGRGCKGEV